MKLNEFQRQILQRIVQDFREHPFVTHRFDVVLEILGREDGLLSEHPVLISKKTYETEKHLIDELIEWWSTHEEIENPDSINCSITHIH